MTWSTRKWNEGMNNTRNCTSEKDIIILEFLARCKTTWILLKIQRNIKIVLRNQITYLSVRNRGNGFIFGWQNQCTFRNVKREQSQVRYVRFDIADGGTNLLILWQCTMCIVLLSRWSITKLARLPRRREKRTQGRTMFSRRKICILEINRRR